ncbi:MAG TPA: membrane protein insertase YidC [Tepidisphaeraceae bacterium]|jgi:YidC/Oxa1 family membrane protein insertase|nr:membrane protein insertase YidC [Tepidisphaeraceae bacterium]
MDKRTWINAISLSMAVIAIWLLYVRWYDKTHPPLPVSPQSQTSTTEPAPTTQTASATTQTAATTAPTTQATQPVMAAALHAVEAGNQTPPNIVLGSGAKDDPDYVLQLALTPIGAGVESVTLNHFNAPVAPGAPKGKKTPYEFQLPRPESINDTRAFATRMVAINHKEIDLSAARWNIAPAQPDTATFFIFIDDANGHVAKVTKTYKIEKRSAKDGSGGYEVGVTQEIADARPARQAKTPLDLRSIINGPTSPPAEVELGGDRAIVAAYVEPKSKLNFETNTLGEFKAEDFSKRPSGEFDPAPTKEPAHTLYDKPFAWIGQSSSYFAAIVLPKDPGAPNFKPRVTQIATGNAEDHEADLSFETTAPKTQMTVYFGPKWRKVLETPYYAAFPRMYEKLLEIKSKMCGWATSDRLIAGLVWILTLFHRLLGDWGLAIICLVLIVRTLLHPITKKSQVQMMKMGKLTPEVEKLKKKYADQPEVLNREMMKLYKQQGGAILGCLPMFLQTPIWIALWSALQGTFELRQAPFLEIHGHYLTWIHDLARPDELINMTRLFGAPIPLYLFGWHLRAINLLPILMAVVTYVNQKYFMPMPIAATPEQKQQQKMQRGMSLFFPLMFYTMPSGLNLYYLTSMSLGIVESKIIRDHIKEQEEIAKAEGPELVPSKPSRNARQNKNDDRDKTPEKPGLMMKIMMAVQKAQEQAEELRKAKEKEKGKRK